MLKITTDLVHWGRAENPPKPIRAGLGIPADYKPTNVLHLYENSRALCGMVAHYRWQRVEKPDGITPICQRCLMTARLRGWVMDATEKTPPPPQPSAYQRHKIYQFKRALKKRA